ncbi:methyl-accepting chemotaxis protein [Halomonas koreensis]|uniref:Nitrate- and nitrite sensing domain-containing protein n=1 Tax=Halomonas koreensis TaxID=245385 RepID=A0ABU1G0N8_9GAMM|nr:nitrate- and nitrite sensing domain-containing protein [Halomonas koreensis]MDR5866503.1 nitrate- and nitrite sensing domain-containing protein [Halomonas koreensis]
MSRFLHRLPVTRKFWLVLALPLLALAWFATSGALERQRLADNMDDLVQLTALSGRAGDLIHALQLERGMTAGYLGSEGRRFGERLEAQRPESTARRDAFEEALAELGAQRLTPALREAATRVRRQLAELPELRRDVDALTADTGSAVARYTAMNQALMAMVERLAHAAEAADITRVLGAYAGLLQAKDLAGIERALLANAFAADAMSGARYRRLLSLQGREAAFLQGFRGLAGEALRERLDAALSGPEIARVEALRERALSAGVAGDYGVDAGQWFDRQTRKLERLKAVEDATATTIRTRALTLRDAARGDFWRYLAIAALAAVLALGLSSLIVRSILGPLAGNLAIIRGRGNDLTQRLSVPGSDELSALYDAFNQASDESEQLVGSIRRGARSVETASGEIAQGNQDLARRTEEQSASLVETASSMQQITATVHQTAESARQAEQMTDRVAEESQQASRVAERAGEAMQRIHAASRRVNGIVGTIDEIAFQTNLLALNASVEAARAGEQGRGFAVVAGEVRQLASRSAEEAQQIRRLIDDSVAHVGDGEALVKATGGSLATIAGQVRDLDALVSEISAAAAEQSGGIEQIHRAMARLEEVTQQNAALVEQVATSSRSLDDQAGDMSALIGRLRISASAADAEAAPVAMPPALPA